MAVLPVGADAKEPDRLHLDKLDLVVFELAGTRQLARKTTLAGALGAWTPPAEQLEVVRRLVTISPLDRQ